MSSFAPSPPGDANNSNPRSRPPRSVSMARTSLPPLGRPRAALHEQLATPASPSPVLASSSEIGEPSNGACVAVPAAAAEDRPNTPTSNFTTGGGSSDQTSSGAHEESYSSSMWDSSNRMSDTLGGSVWYIPETPAAVLKPESSMGATPSNDQRVSMHSSETYMLTPGNSSVFQRSDMKERDVVRPFIPRLLLARCVTNDKTGFRAWIERQATIVFLDVCSYTSIAARAAEQEGPFKLAETINSFFDNVIKTVTKYEGEILKFVGDALICLWTEEEHRDSRQASLAAIECALELCKTTEEDPRSIKIHVGIRHGSLTVKVLHSTATASKTIMPRNYLFVGGEVLRQISAVVDTAPPGQVCIDSSVMNACQPGDLEINPVSVNTLSEDAIRVQRMANRAANIQEHAPHFFMVRSVVTRMNEDLKLESNSTESGNWYGLPIANFNDFLHPTVLDKLRSGLPLTHAAEIRDLGVIFIKKTGRIDVSDWFSEVSEVLEQHRCPITQVMEDDKGILVVAAVNLYQVEEGAHDTVIRAIEALEARRIGAAIGAASGPCFCGPVGSSTRCQWDISGMAAIRACRLMQYAVERTISVAIDQTVVDGVTDHASVKVHNLDGKLKKMEEGISIYTLSMYSCTVLASTARMTEFVAEVRFAEREMLRKVIAEDAIHACAIVRGASLAGKKTAILSAIEGTDYVPIMHKMQLCSPHLSVAHTIAEWFSNAGSSRVRELSRELLSTMEKRSISCSFEIALDLIDELVKSGQKIAIVIDRLQYADHASLMLIQHYRRIMCKKMHTRNCRHASGTSPGGMMDTDDVSPSLSPVQPGLLASLNGEQIDDPYAAEVHGRLLWLCAFTPMASCASLEELSHSVFVEMPPVITLHPMTPEEQCALFQSFGFWRISLKTASLFIKKSGGMPGQFIKMMQWFGPLLATNFVEYREEKILYNELLCDVTSKGVLILTNLGKRTLLEQQFRKIYPGYLSKFVQFCDSLTSEDHIILKIMAIISHFNVTPSVTLISRIASVFIKNAGVPRNGMPHPQPVAPPPSVDTSNDRRSPSSTGRVVSKCHTRGSCDATSPFVGAAQGSSHSSSAEWIHAYLSHRFSKLQDLLLIKLVEQSGRRPSQCSLLSPVMREAIFDIATPVQVRAVCKEAASILQSMHQADKNSAGQTPLEEYENALNLIRLYHGAAEHDRVKHLLNLHWIRVTRYSTDNSAAAAAAATSTTREANSHLGDEKRPSGKYGKQSKAATTDHDREAQLKEELRGYMMKYNILVMNGAGGSSGGGRRGAGQRSRDAASHPGKGVPASMAPLSHLSSADQQQQIAQLSSLSEANTLDTLRTRQNDGVHNKIEQTKNYECPLVLGPLAGLVSRIATTIVVHSLTVVGASRWKLPNVTVGMFMDSVNAFEQYVPGKRAKSADEERELITHLLAEVDDVQESIRKAELFLEYTSTVINSRVKRINCLMEKRKPLAVRERRVSLAPYGVGLKRALDKLENVTSQSPIECPENGVAVREAIMELAVANWASPFPYMTAAKLRDVWFNRWLSACEIRSIVWLFLIIPVPYE